MINELLSTNNILLLIAWLLFYPQLKSFIRDNYMKVKRYHRKLSKWLVIRNLVKGDK